MSRYDWNQTNPGLRDSIEPSRQNEPSHPLYCQLNTEDAVVTFAKHNVRPQRAFMSLPKTLQRQLAFLKVPERAGEQ